MTEKDELQYQLRILQEEIAKLDIIAQYYQLRYPLAQKELSEILIKLKNLSEQEKNGTL